MNRKAALKKPFKFNIIDLLFLLAIIGAIIALIYIFFFRGIETAPTSSSLKEIEYKILLTNIRDEFKGKINIGDNVIDATKLYSIGEVVDVTYKPAIYKGINKFEGIQVFSEFIGFTDITITIKANADDSGYYMIDGVYKINVGTFVSFRVPEFTNSGYCISVKEVIA